MTAKHMRIADALRRGLPAMRARDVYRLPSEEALAREYGASRQTVRSAIALLKSEGLLESRKGSGTYIRRRAGGDSRVIAAVMRSADDYSTPTVLKELRSRLSENGYTVSETYTGNSPLREREALNELLKSPVAGIVTEGCMTALQSPNIDIYARLRAEGTPTVFLRGAYPNSENALCPDIPFEREGYLIAKRLTDKGHARIAGIFQADEAAGAQRCGGVISALRDADMLGEARLSWFTARERAALIQGEDAAWLSTLLAGDLSGASAIICQDDEIAYHVIKLIKRAGRRVPADTAVVGFGQSFYCTLGSPAITTIGASIEDIVRASCDMLLGAISCTEHRNCEIEARLVERESD